MEMPHEFNQYKIGLIGKHFENKNQSVKNELNVKLKKNKRKNKQIQTK